MDDSGSDVMKKLLDLAAAMNEVTEATLVEIAEWTIPQAVDRSPYDPTAANTNMNLRESYDYEVESPLNAFIFSNAINPNNNFPYPVSVEFGLPMAWDQIGAQEMITSPLEEGRKVFAEMAARNFAKVAKTRGFT